MKPEELGRTDLEAQASAPGSPLISVILPLYHEGANLCAVLSDVRAALDKADHSFELILVDDGSPDDTWR